MRRSIYLLTAALFASLVGSSLAGGNLPPRLENFRQILVDSGRPVKQLGDVLEILVWDSLEDVYSPELFEVTGGLEYLIQGRVAGELDILVVEKPEDPRLAPEHPLVHVVGEAKLWRNLKKALAKARAQLHRFEDHHGHDRITSYRYIPQPSRPWEDEYFPEGVEYQTWGPRGAVNSGFHAEIDLTPDEGRLLFSIVKDRGGEIRRSLFQGLWSSMGELGGFEAVPSSF